MNVLELYLEGGFNPGRTLGRKREHHCACPACGGFDRFRIWPEDNNGAGAYNCMGGSGCGLKGDNIQYCRDFLGMDFRAAAEKCGRRDLLGQDNNPRPSYRKPKPLCSPNRSVAVAPFVPTAYDLPPGQWTAKANELVDKCHLDLLAYPKAMAWLAKRGVDRAAVIRYRLGWNSGNGGKPSYKSRADWGLPLVANDSGKNKPLWIPVGLVIPYSIDRQVVRIRIRRPAAERAKAIENLKYYVLPGSYMGTMLLGPDREAHVIVEAELDAIACAAATDLAGAVSVMTIEGKPDADVLAVLRKARVILGALDFEIGEDGAMTKVGKRAGQWWRDQFADTYRRWPVPEGKDPGEAAEAGVDLAIWIKLGLPPVLTLDAGPDGSARKKEASGQSGDFHSGGEEMAALKEHGEDRRVAEGGASEEGQTEQAGNSDILVAATSSGRAFMVARTRAAWVKAVQAGQTVFSAGEVQRLKIGGVGPADADRLLDIKEIFPGSYVSAAREMGN
ncbi:MAG: primase-helicase zinc-binding domain-containing protein [Desulfobulbales bacterium]|nr:primase-helicase zinc-binding domain-containing protein [Desulfobulbales bacterium]